MTPIGEIEDRRRAAWADVCNVEAVCSRVRGPTVPARLYDRWRAVWAAFAALFASPEDRGAWVRALRAGGAP